MNKLRFYHVAEKYINYLHSIDHRVQYNKGQSRPYIGVVLCVNNHKYFVPLESPKPNHVNIKSGGSVIKLDNGNLGIMGINNMIPIVDECLLNFNIEEEADEKYKKLLYNQLSYCNKNYDIIQKRALTVYNKYNSGNSFYLKVCCNFKKLEKASLKYDPNHKKKH